MLVYLGRYQEAETVFTAIEKMKPGLYNTAANLGTTYELLGKNELALKWLRRAVQINPESHRGSEWIHIRILETKICGDSCITTNYLLGKDWGNADQPTSDFSRDSLLVLKNQLFYQLNERVSFVPKPNKIVAQLLTDLGAIDMLLGYKYDADHVYDFAQSYGAKDMLTKKRRALALQENSKPLPLKQNTVTQLPPSVNQSLWPFIIGTMLVLLIAAIAIFRKWDLA